MAMPLTGETTHDRPIGPRGALLQQLLEAATTTQSQMAKLVHVDRSTIVEKGLRSALIELATLPKARQVEVLRDVLAERRARTERSASA